MTDKSTTGTASACETTFNPFEWVRVAVAAGEDPHIIGPHIIGPHIIGPHIIGQGGCPIMLSRTSPAGGIDFPPDPEGTANRWAVFEALYRSGRAFGVTAELMDEARVRLWTPEGGPDAELIALVRDYHAAGAAATGISMDTPEGEADGDRLFRRREEAFFRLAGIVPRTSAGIIAKLGLVSFGQIDLTKAETDAYDTIIRTCVEALETMTVAPCHEAVSAQCHPETDAARGCVPEISAAVLLASLDRLTERGDVTAQEGEWFRAWVQHTKTGDVSRLSPSAAFDETLTMFDGPLPTTPIAAMIQAGAAAGGIPESKVAAVWKSMIGELTTDTVTDTGV
jgi:hypothetical protein